LPPRVTPTLVTPLRFNR